MFLETKSCRWFKARSVNQTSNGYVAKTTTATEPKDDAGTATGASVITLGYGNGNPVPSSFKALFYGVGTDGQTFSCQIYGWNQAGTEADEILWIPTPLLEVQVTLSSAIPGILSRYVKSTELFADTIAIVGTEGNPNVSCELISPANDRIAHAKFSVVGFAKLELTFTTGASATSCNALLSGM